MKNIIKRIIVGVGIALILMLIKDHGLILQAQAKTYNIIPNELRLTYTNTNHTTSTTTYSTLNEITDNEFPYSTFYGRSNFNQNYFMHQQLYRLETTNAMKTGFYDVYFLMYQDFPLGGDTPAMPHTFNLRNNSRIFTCSNDDSPPTIYQDGTANWQTGIYDHRQVIGVKCENVYLDLSNNNVVYAIVMSTDPKAWTNTAYGITPVTFQWGALNSQVEIAQQQKETNDTLKDETAPDTNNLFENEDVGSLSNSPVSDLITMPISLLQAINNNASSSCTTWNLGALLGTNLLMPCINLQQILGSTLYNLIDMAICLFLAYNIGLLCISIYNNVISLNDDFDNMYSPKHSYHGRHEEGSAID